jgi:hypothetical protein
MAAKTIEKAKKTLFDVKLAAKLQLSVWQHQYPYKFQLEIKNLPNF